ncbi:hypothetical protein [Acinetobacter sp. P8-3-8]|uniref:hypothetical protein n=1 Tax=Acinetobacter sp. P8-3-8 TaxID=1029823 RepID=UPI00024871D8|nr:hypothetical protein [Acinetobacter sp. P8-3-8]
MDIQKERESFEAYMAEKYKNLMDRRQCLNNGGGYMAWDMNVAWKVWQAAKAQAVPEGFVLVPRECPDPIFADKLFDHLCKKAHGEFGDDQMIFFSDIDESAIWQLMIEAQEQSYDNSN